MKWYYIGLIFFAFACNQKKVDTVPQNHVVTTTIEDKSHDTTYFNSLTLGDYTVNVYSINHFGNYELIVHSSDGERMLGEADTQIPGNVYGSMVNDLNGDGAPEVYVLSHATSDSASLNVFNIKGDVCLELSTPVAPKDSACNYSINNNQLTQTIQFADGRKLEKRYTLSANNKFIEC